MKNVDSIKFLLCGCNSCLRFFLQKYAIFCLTNKEVPTNFLDEQDACNQTSEKIRKIKSKLEKVKVLSL